MQKFQVLRVQFGGWPGAQFRSGILKADEVAVDIVFYTVSTRWFRFVALAEYQSGSLLQKIGRRTIANLDFPQLAGLAALAALWVGSSRSCPCHSLNSFRTRSTGITTIDLTAPNRTLFRFEIP
jgi:hypothetical protein